MTLTSQERAIKEQVCAECQEWGYRGVVGWLQRMGHVYLEAKHAVDYLRLDRSEHCNTFREVMDEIRRHFVVEATRYLPFCIPVLALNAVVAMRCAKR